MRALHGRHARPETKGSIARLDGVVLAAYSAVSWISYVSEEGLDPVEERRRVGFASARSSLTSRAEPVGIKPQAMWRGQARATLRCEQPEVGSDGRVVEAFADVAGVMVEGVLAHRHWHPGMFFHDLPV